MKKIIVACFAALLLVFGGVSSAQADEYLRVGMEAAYAPFNWTQDDNSNGAIPIEGTKQYANGYDVQIAKKIAEAPVSYTHLDVYKRQPLDPPDRLRQRVLL